MIITCEKCEGSFKLDEKLLKPGGTKVKCSKCKYIFSAFPPGKERPAIGPSEVELIVCEQCGAGFKMKSALLKSEGSKVRCSKCTHIFLAFPSLAGPAPKAKEVEIEEPDAGVEEAAPEQAEDGLDFSLEEEQIEDTADLPPGLDLEIEEEPAEVEPSGGSGDMELDLDDDEGDLDLEIEEEPAEVEPSGGSGDMELELDDDEGDLDLEIDEDEGLDLGGEEETVAEPSGGSGDMELELDDDEGDLDLEIDEDEDLDLGGEEESAAEPSEASDDMELELDGGEEEGEDDGIDFSEVDSLLGTDDVSVMDTVEVSASELDLDLDDDDDSVGGVQQQEIDLADLEQTIEMELLEPEEESDEEEPEDIELELADDEEEEDLDEEIALAEGEEEDFSDIEEMLAGGDDEETIELDLDGEEAEEAEEDEAGEETVVKGKKEKPSKKKQEKKAKVKKEKKPKAKKEKPKKKGKKSFAKIFLVAAIIVLVLIGLVVGAIVLKPSLFPPIVPSILGELGLGGLVGAGQTLPASSDSVIVMDNTIQSDFVANAKHGKLFIIKGSVKNETSAPKRFIKVVANLYSEGHTLEMTSSAYCGNILSNEALASSDLAGINARLAVKVGDNSRNANVQPGMVIPFMVVIPEMPENLVEYEVLVSEASPVG